MKKVTKKIKETKKAAETPRGAKIKAKKTTVKAKASASREPIGIFGGAFNPVHVGHLNAALTVYKKLKLKKVIFVPTGKAAHREISGPSGEQRLAMVKVAIQPYSQELTWSDIEVKKSGVTYTYDTLKELAREHAAQDLYFIMGADAFKEFPQWKNFPKLLEMANFVVTSRPGSDLSLRRADWPEGLAPHVESSSPTKLTLKSGLTISKVDLEDFDISATELRKRLRNGGNIQNYVPSGVFELIRREGLYKRTSPLVSDYREFALQCGQRALDKKALGLKIYDMTAMNSYADYSVICSATSNRHAASVAQGILDAVKEETGLNPISLEGMREGLWVLIDYGSVVIHVFQDSVRDQYRIEHLWRNCTQIQDDLKTLPPVRSENSTRENSTP